MHTEEAIGLAVVIGHVLMFWITRWRFVFRPNQHHALAKIHVVGASAVHDAERELLIKAERQVKCEDVEGWPRRTVFWIGRFVTWNGSREIYGWRLAHEAQRLRAAQLPEPAVAARLERGLFELSEFPQGEGDNWREPLEQALASTAQPERSRATLAEFLRDLYEHRDRRAEELSEAENKISWLVFACATVLGILVIDGFGTLLGAGAIGGLLSRLQRVLSEHDPADYGFSWALLFLVPITGALAAWAAMLVLVLLQDVGIVDLAFLQGDDPLRNPDYSVLAVALVLGFSERFFQLLADRTLSAAV